MTSTDPIVRRRRSLDLRVLRDAVALALIVVGLIVVNVAGFSLGAWHGVATVGASMIFVGVLLGLDTSNDRG